MSRHVKDKISLYIDGKLEGAALKSFEAHVKTCGECGSALAETKQAVKAAKGKVKDVDLPVNFYVKLNKKLDAVDAAGKAPAFNWGNFARGAAAVCTMLIVGVFVYTLGKQTGNFSDIRMKQDEQMPKTVEAPVKTKKEDTAAGGKAVVKLQAAPMKKKAVEQENAYVTDKITLDVAEKKDADLEYKGYVQKEAALDAKMESLGFAEKSVVTETRSLKPAASAPAAKMKVAADTDMSAGAGMVMDEAAVGGPVAEEEQGPYVKNLEEPVPAQTGPKTFIFKDEEAWKAFSAGKTLSDPGVTDWDAQMVVVILFPSYSYAATKELVKIYSVVYEQDKIIVSFRKMESETGEFAVPLSRYPHAVKAVKKSDLPVEFREIQ